MFKRLLMVLAVPVLLAACSKKSNDCPYTDVPIVATAAEVSALRDSILARGISATQHPSGFFYVIDQAGTGATPGLCSAITFHYKGELLNGSVFGNSYTDPNFPNGVGGYQLGQLIPAWAKGLPLIKAGGKMRLYVPPSLGYGDVAQPGIPANSNLVFTLDLLAVQ